MFDSNFHPQTIPRLVCWSLAPFIAFFLGRFWLDVLFLIFANVLIYFGIFANYTSYAIVLVIVFTQPKLKYIGIGSYLLNTLIFNQLQHREPSHIAIHIACCVWLWIKMSDILYRRKREFNLTDDEIKILDYKMNGVQQNDIPEFSANTVGRKLKAAAERNGFHDAKEFFTEYQKQSHHENGA